MEQEAQEVEGSEAEESTGKKVTFAGQTASKTSGKKVNRMDARLTLSQQPPRDPSEFFKGGSLAKKAKGLRLGLWGGPGSAKSHCALTCPKPVYVVDTEFGVYPLLEQPEFAKWLQPNLKEDYIKVFEAAILDRDSAEPDPLLSLDAVEQALTALVSVNQGTIVIDTITDLWQWINSWLEDVAMKRSEKTGDKYRFEWGKANSRYRLNMMRILTKPLNMVVIGQDRPIYSDKGEETSSTKGDWQKKTPHWVDLSLRCWKGSDGKFRGEVDKCRIGDFKQKLITPVTYDAIVGWMKTEFPWRTINPQGFTSIDEIIALAKQQDT